jgi:GT2 family glycosyltransferase
MIGEKKIGVGIVTYNRPDQLKRLIQSLEICPLDDILDTGIVVNDGEIFELGLDDQPSIHNNSWIWIDNDVNIGVGKSKNKALQYLLDQDCDYFFLIEDDIYIKDPSVFEKYVEACEKTGIQHFNYSQHGIMNKDWSGSFAPNPVTTIRYESANLYIPLYPHCVGAFSFYTKKCLSEVGLLDERYYNACEHVDHTLAIIGAGMHPPFWHFADIENSWEHLGDEEWSLEQSKISGKPGHDNIVSFADEIFRMKHGVTPGQIPVAPFEKVVESIKQIKKTYAV